MRTFTHAQMFGLVALVGLAAAPAVASASPSAGSSFSANVAEGHFETRIADMLDGTTRVTHHVVLGEGKEVEVRFAEPTDLAYRTKVRVEGQVGADGVMAVDNLEVLESPPQPAIDPELRAPRRIATILVFWEGAGLPNGEARQSMFTGDRSTQVFYGENSYGMETVVGEVFGPYQIDDPGGCNTPQIAYLARKAMEEKGHDPYDFDQFMYHFPGISGCGFAGLASVGSPLYPASDSWYNGSFGCVVRNQEIGHNYGMGHSHAYTCTEPDENDVMHEVPLSLTDNCEHIEYGDPYDPMGGGCGHMNVIQKAYMGWLDGCNIVTAESDGVFNLAPIELPCNGTQALRFEAFDGRYYYLEYRQRIGEFDGPSGQDGVLLHLGGRDEPTSQEQGQQFSSPYILDVGQNGFLHAGDSYTDDRNGVTFTVLEESSAGARVQLSFPDGGSGAAPTCLDGSEPIEDAGAIGSTECSEIPYPADLEAPTVTLTYPEDGQVFEPGTDFTITAEVADDRLVTELELYVDGEPMFRLFEPPWEWEVEDIPEGTYEFGIVAKDGRNWTPSQAVDITVSSDPVDDGGDTDGGTGGQEPPHETGEFTTDDGDADEDGTGATDNGCGCRTDDRPAGSGALLALALFGLGYAGRRRG
jgi:MYXO-CTERM domain-containing protein